MNKKFLLFLLTFCFQIILFAEHNNNPESALNRFWSILIHDYQFGYTLFDNKPLTFNRYQLFLTLGIPAHCNENIHLKSLWPVWENQVSSNLESSYVLNKVKFDYENQPFEEFYLINKPACLNIISTHWEDFAKEFKEHSNPESVLQDLCLNGPHIIQSHYLLGLLLGFGKHNSFLFQKRDDLFDTLVAYFPWQNNKTLAVLTPHEWLNILNRRKQAVFLKNKNFWTETLLQYRLIDQELNSTFYQSLPYSPLIAIPLPIFVANEEHPETQALLKQYLKASEKINQIFYDENFLQLVLEQLGVSLKQSL